MRDHEQERGQPESGDLYPDASSLLEALVSHLSSGVLVEDGARRIQLVNPRFCELFGIPDPPESLRGLDCAETAQAMSAIFADSDKFLKQTLWLVTDRKVILGQEVSLADGRILVRDYIPILADGEFRGHLWQYQDITARKHIENDLRESEARYRLVTETATDGIITIDESSRILFVNRSIRDMFGYDPAELVGQPLMKLMPQRMQEGHNAALEKYLVTGKKTLSWSAVQVAGLRRDGSEIPLEVSFGESKHEAGRTFTGILRDVSKRKKVEKELRLAKEEAEKANQAKSQFLAIMSHEIRTPLNSIIGMTQLASMSSDLPPELEDYLRTIRSSSEVLLSLISDILDFSKIEAGRKELEEIPFQIREALDEVTGLLSVRSEAKGIELVGWVESNVPESIIGDAHGLRQILLNLIGNAIKFTEEGEVSLRVSLQLEEAEQIWLRFAVCDTGIGIPRRDQQRIFAPFTQADGSTTRRFGGSGLGLAIAKSLVNLMGGEIRVTSEPGSGSTFSFEIPFRRDSSERTRPRETFKELEGLRLLVIDDNRTSREAITDQISGLGCEVKAVSGWEEAGHDLALETALPDVLLLDESLLSGPEKRFIKRNSRIPRTNRVTLILLAAVGHIRRLEKPERFDGIIQKPIQIAEIGNALLKILRAPETVADSPKKTQGQQEGSLQLRILLVEDNPDNQKLALRMLTRLGHSVEVAHNGREGLAMTRQGDFDLILMDLQMPEMDGFEATRLIRKDEQKRSLERTPIVALAADTLKETRQRCLDIGMDDYYSKPVDWSLLELGMRALVTGSVDPVPGGDPSPRPPLLQQTVRIDPEIADLVPEFLEERREDVKRLRKALENHNYRLISKLGHNMKGSGAGYGFSAITEIGAELETAARARHDSELRSSIRQLSDYLDLVKIQ